MVHKILKSVRFYKEYLVGIYLFKINRKLYEIF